MPGIVVFKRRWSAGSDDFVLPALLLMILHGIWLTILCITMGVTASEYDDSCFIGGMSLQSFDLGYVVSLAAGLILEIVLFLVSLRGTILETEPRVSVQYILYTRLGILLFELAWQIVGVVWLAKHYMSCPSETPKKVTLAMNICNWLILLVIGISVWCTYDHAGGKWVKMKRFQESLKERQTRNKRPSGRRNWRQSKAGLFEVLMPFFLLVQPLPRRRSLLRLFSAYLKSHRKTIRAYEESWDRRFNLLCCCVERKNNNRNTIAEIAKLFTEFFRDLDVVPSDVIAGFVLLRHYQSLRRRHVVSQDNNVICDHLSGTPITPTTSFLQLSQPNVLAEYQKVIHYMRLALAAYGWPAVVMMKTDANCCGLLPKLRCCCCVNKPLLEYVQDNCCQCNFVALLKLSQLRECDIVYATYHVDIGETPFYVAIDHKYKTVVICVRGTTSLQDVLTDLKADAEILPLNPPIETWVGHKGMVQAAVYIKDRLKEDNLLSKAFSKDDVDETYELVLVGHSLGAGTAAILAILLRQEFPNLHCYAFSPPGGLLSEACVEETKSFITSVVVGKDVVPRIGLSQLEVLRADLINVIKNSKEPKWKIIARGVCCGNAEARKMNLDEVRIEMERDIRAHPSDEDIALSAHTPLYPPGKIIHIVRSHPSGKRKSFRCCQPHQPVYQAIWASNHAFDEVLVSPSMINDHMPDYVLEALEKVLVNVAPPKPERILSEEERQAFLDERSPSGNTLKAETKDEQNVNTEVETLPRFLYEKTDEEPTITVGPDGQLVVYSSKKKPKLLMDLNSDEPVEAPLASPDTLSERSSVLNSLSQTSELDKGKENCRMTLQSPPALETIKQSPELRKHEFVNKSSSSCESQCKQCNGNVVKTCAVVESNPLFNKECSDGHPESTPPPPKLNEKENTALLLVSSSERHSPEETLQAEYEDPNYYYTAAGIGYPHGSGAYHPPLVVTNLTSSDGGSAATPFKSKSDVGCVNSPMHRIKSTCQYQETGDNSEETLKTSQSESHLQTLSEKYRMKRSQEQGDIAHLQDSAKVYHSSNMLPIRESLDSIGEDEDSQLLRATSTEGISVFTSPSTDSEKPLSSAQSDDVFDLPLEESDV
ncbi:diacylglycerol lipase-alpha-like isoform X1 [Saccostrea echinata]|uniref:diacylglycerol lipase-alpha-like isoform X1 n=1 Tax=Saccostrea echinata TaxID=191078 RepID=UPI002A82AEB0|nr:diacylglycerol lipase-alpha-like isoform X1 [Saccostrea echinata]